MTTSDYLIEYMKIHLISLEQDLEKLQIDYVDNDNDDALDWMLINRGHQESTRHLLSVADDRMKS